MKNIGFCFLNNLLIACSFSLHSTFYICFIELVSCNSNYSFFALISVFHQVAVARSFCRSVDVFDQDIHIRNLHT